ncbi:MAG TPA: VWA domain-containing protein [Candidatus Acidoferrales bacterium]|nr:VWA domain-containing protein [Candidatus Acidoferrales bacterium]
MKLTISSHGRRLFRTGFLVPGLFLFCSLASYSRSPQSLPPSSTSAQSTISSKTDMVALPVSVTDAKGNVVSGLSQQNFRVYEDGRLQKVTSFQHGDTPVTVGLIVDHSRSMGPKLPEVASAVSSFAHSSNPQDELFVVDFNDDVSVELLGGKAFTNDPAELEKALFSVRARGRTALYDAVAEGLLHLRLGHFDRKALIIVSDGGDNASQQKFSQVLALAQQSQVLIYSIALVSDEGEENPGVLRHLSKATGGVTYFPGPAITVTAISTQIARDLREQYTLGFTPEKANNPHAFRKIEVKVAAPGHPKIHVRTRSGYVAADEKSSLAQPSKGAK